MAVAAKPGGRAWVEVRCASCRARRTVSARQGRRAALLCNVCRTFATRPRKPPDESDYWWWLERFGVRRNGLSAAEHVRTHSLPPTLEEIVAGLFGPRETWARYRQR